MRKIKYILLGLGGLLILIGVSLNQRKDYFLNGYWLDESGTLYEF